MTILKVYIIFFFVVVSSIFSFAQSKKSDIKDEIFKAYIEFEKGNYKITVEQCSEILKKKQDSDLYLLRGNANLKLCLYNQALADFEDANKLQSGIADLEIAKTFSITGNYKQSLIFINNHLRKADHLTRYELSKDTSFKQLKETNQWTEFWSNLKIKEYDTQIEDALFEMEMKNYKFAVSMLNDVIWDNPKCAKALEIRGIANRLLGNYETSVYDFNQSLKLKKNDVKVLKERAYTYMLLNKPQKALDDYSQAIEIEPFNRDLYKQRASVYLKLKSYDLAIQDYNLISANYPDDNDIKYLGSEIFYEQGDNLSALKLLNELINVDNSKPGYYILRGDCYLKAKYFDKAAEDFGMALDLDPNNGKAYLKRGMALVNSGSQQRALADFKKAKELGILNQ